MGIVRRQARFDQAAIQLLHNLLRCRQCGRAALHNIPWHPVVGALCQCIRVGLDMQRGGGVNKG